MKTAMGCFINGFLFPERGGVGLMEFCEGFAPLRLALSSGPGEGCFEEKTTVAAGADVATAMAKVAAITAITRCFIMLLGMIVRQAEARRYCSIGLADRARPGRSNVGKPGAPRTSGLSRNRWCSRSIQSLPEALGCLQLAAVETARGLHSILQAPRIAWIEPYAIWKHGARNGVAAQPFLSGVLIGIVFLVLDELCVTGQPTHDRPDIVPPADAFVGIIGSAPEVRRVSFIRFPPDDRSRFERGHFARGINVRFVPHHRAKPPGHKNGR